MYWLQMCSSLRLNVVHNVSLLAGHQFVDEARTWADVQHQSVPLQTQSQVVLFVKSAGPGHCIILGGHLLRLAQLAVIAVAAVLAKSLAGVPLRCTMSLRNACGMFTLVIWMHVLLRGLG